LKEWREFEYSRIQKKTPVIETIDSMIAEVEQELANVANIEHEIYFRGR